MDKVKLEFTLNGRKNTYFRRFDVKEADIKKILTKLIKEYGKNNIKDVKPIKG